MRQKRTLPAQPFVSSLLKIQALTALLIFIDNPEAAGLRNPLSAGAGAADALRVHEEHLARMRSELQDFPGERFVFYSDYPNWNDAWDINTYRKRLQQGDNAGDRISEAFKAVFEDGHDQALWIDANRFALTTGIIDAAEAALSSFDVVVGPADDGGRYLIGLKRRHLSLLPAISADAAEEPGISEHASDLSVHRLAVLERLQGPDKLLRSGPGI